MTWPVDVQGTSSSVVTLRAGISGLSVAGPASFAQYTATIDAYLAVLAHLPAQASDVAIHITVMPQKPSRPPRTLEQR